MAPISVPVLDQPTEAPATMMKAGNMYVNVVALRRALAGREMITLSPGCAPTGLSTSISIVLPELGLQKSLAPHSPQASVLTMETLARLPTTEIT